MGTKRPDVIRRPPSPGEALTLGEMKAAGWHVREVCPDCKTMLWVDLDVLVRAYGPDVLFWGRSAACRAWFWGDYDRCPGRVHFQARSIRAGSWVELALTGWARDMWLLRQGRGPLSGNEGVDTG